ncbi:hypothetical protein TNIN_370941 [Trichonephila inaurata madagascariensis]|uniref:Uncharacterized protein n=1 Tax=Trichonephila inaurata madagascariensis TaxID=2747483 RepID=A0A8X6IPH3_9ARAC|nr:hypothetical protein TNIN_370941 [Trichonephila inaurata madagascariensis]
MERVIALCIYRSITKVHNQATNHESPTTKAYSLEFQEGPRWNRYSQLSDKYVTEDLINDNPDKSDEFFVKGILRAAKESIPREQVKKHLPFWNEFLDLLKSERNAARCRAENSHNIADRILLRKTQAKLKRAIIISKRTTYRSFAANLDFRTDGPRAHRFVSHLNNENSSQHWEPITANGKLLTRLTEATALSKNYAAISKLHITAKDRKLIFGPAPSPTEQGSLLLKMDFSYDELLLATNSMMKGKSTGPDGVLP